MNDLHAIYGLEERVGPARAERWATYSYPMSIYVAGGHLAEVRAEFRNAFDDVADLVGEGCRIVEHVERPLLEGVYVRTADDRRKTDRTKAAQRFEATLADPAHRDDFVARAPVSATGDIVVVACVGDDRISWLLEQMNEHDSLVICLATDEPAVWWTWLAGARARLNEAHVGTLADVGLTAESSVADLVRVGAGSAGHSPGLLVPAA